MCVQFDDANNRRFPMTGRTRAVLLVALAAIIVIAFLSLVSCAGPAPQGRNGPVVTTEQDDETSTGEHPDCDTEDRHKNEVPDCGFRHAGKFYAWSWVKAGRKTAPSGWSATRERAAVVAALSRPTTPATTRPATIAPARPANPAPRPTTARTTTKKQVTPVARKRR